MRELNRSLYAFTNSNCRWYIEQPFIFPQITLGMPFYILPVAAFKSLRAQQKQSIKI